MTAADGSTRSYIDAVRRWRRQRHAGPRIVPWLFAVPGVAFLVIFHIAAQTQGAWYSFTDWTGIGHAKWVGLQNFRSIFRSDLERGAFIHSLELAGLFLVIVNVVGLTLALSLQRTLKSRLLLRSLFLLPIVLSPLASAYIWQYIFDINGPLNRLLGFVGLHSWERGWLGDPQWALWTVLIALVWQYTGLSMIIYLAGLEGIPEELDEAGAVDGASPWFRFRHVTLPLLAPAVTVSGTLTLVFGLRTFDQVLALTGGGPDHSSETLASQMYEQTFVYGLYGYGSAIALILTLLIMVLGLGQLVILRMREARLG